MDDWRDLPGFERVLVGEECAVDDKDGCRGCRGWEWKTRGDGPI